MCLKTDNILLPQTEEEFEELVDELVLRYTVKDRTHVAVVLANQIQRFPADQYLTTIEFLGGMILKSIAYSVALHKSRTLSQRHQIDLIAAQLKYNPLDQQALDALETASKDGIEYAKEILSLYRPVDAGDNVVKMHTVVDETKGSVVQ